MKQITDFYPNFEFTEDTKIEIESTALFTISYPLFPTGAAPHKYRDYLVDQAIESLRKEESLKSSIEKP